MGTRADFYLDRDGKLEWIGSSAYDGNPADLPKICSAKTEKDYKAGLFGASPLFLNARYEVHRTSLAKGPRAEDIDSARE